MKLSKHMFLPLMAFLSLVLCACSSRGVYGVYSFRMGSTKGSHFSVALNLNRDTMTDDDGKTLNTLSFDYANVKAASSGGSSEESVDISSEETSEESLSVSSEDSSVNSSVESSSGPDVTSVSGLDINENGTHISGLWAFESDNVKLDIELYFTSYYSDGTQKTTFLPSAITSIFVEVSIHDKTADVVVPVSLEDALEKLLDILSGEDPSTISIPTVTISLTKEDNARL